MPVERVLVGVNARVLPHLETWGWEVALDLFLGGIVAGLLVVGGVIRLTAPDRFPRTLLVADLVGLPLLGAGLFLLWIDLGVRLNAWRFYLSFEPTSAMWWGSWILLLSLALLAVRMHERLVARLPRWPLRGLAGRARRADRGLAVAGIVLGLGLGSYTGLLLATIVARPLWSSPLLPPLFLASGLGTGMALLWALARDERQYLTRPAVALWLVEIVMLGAYVVGLRAFGGAGSEAAGLLDEGLAAVGFWGVTLVAGLLAPLALAAALPRGARATAPVAAAALLKITGGLALRVVVVYAGLASAL